MNNRKTPRIRFKGFTDDWEQRKLGELYAKSCEKNDGSVGIDRNITVATMQFKDDVKVSTTEYLKTYYTFNVGDIAFEGHQSKEFRFGRFVENDIGNGIVSHIFAVFRPIVEYDLKFWKYAINNERLMQIVLSRSTKASTMMHDLVTDDFLNESFLVPTIEEQRKIGDYLFTLDHLITLHQRKLEKLKIVKKAMLENCFPKNGEKVPEFRFSGFTGDWEQRKLGEIANYRRGSFPQPYGKSEWYDGEGARPFVQVADITDDMNLVKDTKQKISELAQSMSVFAEKNSVLVTLQGSIGRVAIAQYGAFIDRTILIFENYNVEIESSFWAYIIKQKFENEARIAPGGTIKTITKETLSDFDLIIPHYSEQKKLGAFLESLDHLITLHQRKLEKLKIIKKSFLEKMFV